MLGRKLFGTPELLCVVMVGLGLVALSGCTICCEQEDEAYSAYGGVWQRTNRYHGRVGSLVGDAGAKSSKFSDRDQPSSPDELERQRRAEEGIDDSALEPDKDPSSDSTDADRQDEKSEEEKLRERREELKKQELEDITVIRGPIVPPALHAPAKHEPSLY